MWAFLTLPRIMRITCRRVLLDFLWRLSSGPLCHVAPASLLDTSVFMLALVRRIHCQRFVPDLSRRLLARRLGSAVLCLLPTSWLLFCLFGLPPSRTGTWQQLVASCYPRRVEIRRIRFLAMRMFHGTSRCTYAQYSRLTGLLKRE